MGNKNLLVIAVDDLNAWLTAPDMYNGPLHTPNMQRLMQQGTTFVNAHAQIALCNPSRISVWTGETPAHTGVHNNNVHTWRMIDPQTTLHHALREAGYESVGAGKIYHAPGPPAVVQALFDSYSDDGIEPEGRPFTGDVKDLKDWRNTSAAIDFLEAHDASVDAPFVLSLGLRRPHLPWSAPPEFFEMYARDDIQLPAHLPSDMADVPGAAMQEIDRPVLTSMPLDDSWKSTLRGYLAATSFTDAMVGRVLDALERSGAADNTTIVLWSDNGYHMGDKSIFFKHTLWDGSTRVPLVIIDPEVGRPGQVIEHAVELVDIFPTVLDLLGIPASTPRDGHSLVPLMRNPDASWDGAAVTSLYGNFSIRTGDWRYTRYFDGSEELYRSTADPNEWFNRAGVPMFASVKASLAARLDSYFVANDIVWAGPGRDRIDGSGANDMLINAGSDQTMAGGKGDDTYIVAPGTQPTIIERPGGGTDTVVCAVSCRLSPEIENAYVRDIATPTVMVGNALANRLVGSNIAADILAGGLGPDTLNGIGSDDIYRYESVADSPAGQETDVIEAFEGAGEAGGDRLDLSAIDADPSLAGDQAFTFIGTSEFSGPGQVRVSNLGRLTLVEATTNSLGVADLAIVVVDGAADAADWSAGDFAL